MTISNTVNQLRMIANGEKFKSAWVARSDDPDLIDAVFSVSQDGGDTRYEKRCVVSFKDVTREQLIVLARYDIVVELQKRLRDMAEGMLDPSNYDHVSVMDDIINGKGVRRPVDPRAAIRRNAAALGLTETQIVEMLAIVDQKNADHENVIE